MHRQAEIPVCIQGGIHVFQFVKLNGSLLIHVQYRKKISPPPLLFRGSGII